MARSIFMTALVAAAMGCGGADRTDTAVADSLNRDLQLAPVDTTAPMNDQPAAEPAPAETPTPQRPAPRQTTPTQQPPAAQPAPAKTTPAPAAQTPAPAVAPAPLTLPAGTVIRASVDDSLNSRTDLPGQTLTATIGADVKDDNGRTIIPAGSRINLTVSELKAAPNKSSEGTIVLTVASITAKGQTYPVSATIDSVEHYLKGRGVGTSEAAKVGAGAVAGAIAGRIIGGKKGTVIGGVIGAAAGTGVAVETADRDVVVPAGARLVIRLDQEMSVSDS
jgi:hypothetical protein